MAGTEGSRPGCLKGVTFSEAEDACADAGLRLCTQFEVEAGIGAGSGCDFDGYHVWTSTMCGSMYVIVDGDDDNANGGSNKPAECTSAASTNGIASNDHGTLIGVQCCNMAGTEGSRPGCLKGVTFSEAEDACADAGLRLCTQFEVEAGIGAGSGCDFDGYHVWTSTPCSAGFTVPPQTCHYCTATARYIYIDLPNDWLNLNQVTAYDGSGAVIPAVNALLSSTHSALYPASHCIDGDTSTMCHSGSGSDNWLQIDLGSAKEISSVSIVNRLNCCGHRIDGATVSLYTGNGATGTLAQQWRVSATDSTAALNFDVTCAGTEASAAHSFADAPKFSIGEGEGEWTGGANDGDGDHDTIVVLNVSRSALELFVFAVAAVSVLLCVGWCFGGFCGQKSAYAKVAFVSETDTEENDAINDCDEQL